MYQYNVLTNVEAEQKKEYSLGFVGIAFYKRNKQG